MKKFVFRAFQTARSAHYGLPAKLAEISAGINTLPDISRIRRHIFHIEINISRNKQIEPPVFVVIAEALRRLTSL